MQHRCLYGLLASLLLLLRRHLLRLSQLDLQTSLLLYL